ncbi:hypothetical protein Tco_0970423 [Tanacetum coccineum]
MSVLLHPGRGQYNIGLSSGPLGLSSVQLGRGPSVMNDHLFWVDASDFPLAVPWHNNETLRKDPHPTPDEFDANVYDYLVDNPAPFRKLLEPFLCFVGISRYYGLDENCYPTFWTDDDEGGCSLLAPFGLFSLTVPDLFLLYAEMDLFAFINHADPTKVQIGEREVGEEEVPLLQLTRDRVVPLAGVNDQGNTNVQGAGNDNVNEGGGDVVGEIQAIVAENPRVQNRRRKADGASGSNHPRKKLRADHGTFSDVGASTGGKSLAAIQELFDQSTLNVEVGITAAATVPFVTSFVTPTPEREEGGCTDSVSGPNLHDEVTSIVRSSMLPPPVVTTTITTTIIANATSALVLGAGTKPVPHNIFRDSTSTGEANQDVAGLSHPARTELSTDSFFVSQDVDSETLYQIYILKWNVTNDSALDDPDICRGVIDHLAPPALFS